MKNDDEVEGSMRETTALIQETQQIFEQSITVYKSFLAKDIERAVENLRREGRTPAIINELAAIVESTKKPLATLRKSQIKRTRALRVVVHKNEAHANDRLFEALKRMKQDAKDFQEKMVEIADKSKKKD